MKLCCVFVKRVSLSSLLLSLIPNSSNNEALGLFDVSAARQFFDQMGPRLKNQLFLQIASLIFLNKTTITEQTNLLAGGLHEMWVCERGISLKQS